MGSPRPLPLRRRGLLRLGTTEAPAAEAKGPLSLWDHRGPAAGITKAPAAEALRLGTTEAPAAEAKGPLSLWDHRGPRR